MTSTALIDTNTMSYEAIAALIGQDTGGGGGNTLPDLKINGDVEDDNGNDLKPGTFMYPTVDGLVYGKPVLFRPFMQGFQYSHFDPDEKKYVNRSIIAKSFREEFVDELGGTKCGKVKRDILESLSQEQQAIQKQITCYRLVYGTVSFTGLTATGQEVEVVDAPTRLKLRGSNFMPIGDVLDTLAKQRKLMFNFNIALDTKREKNGGTTYYVIQPTIDMAQKPIQFTPADMELVKNFQALLDRENTAVREKYSRALRKSAPFDNDDATIIDGVTGALDEDFGDDISDVN